MKPRLSAQSIEHDLAQADARMRELAATFELVPEADFRCMAGVTQGTLESWRRRGHGPAYVILGNRVYYPRAAVAEFLAQQTRTTNNPQIARAL